MQTKLGVFCDRVMEAGWLITVVLAPLYFNVYSNRVFEPDKIALVRSIALLMAVAWVVKTVDSLLAAGKNRAPASAPAPAPLLQRINRQNVLALPALALVIVYIVSSIASVSPMVTLWGSYQRLQGTYSTFSYIVIFFLATATIKQREQLDRVVSVVILTSVPIAIYGMVEHLKLEFLPWGGDVTLRVTSTMGNPIFIAAYLIMTVPLALARLLTRAMDFQKQTGLGQDRPGNSAALAAVLLAVTQAIVWFVLLYTGLDIFGKSLLGQSYPSLELVVFLISVIVTVGLPFAVRRGLPALLSASFYGTVALVGLATILFSQSRGPQLGLAAGLVVFVFLFAMKWNSRAVWYAGLAAAVLALSLLVAINTPNSPLSFVRNMPYIGRLATLIEDGGSTSVRSLIWQGARQLIGWHEPLQTPDGPADALNLVRPLIGYGPDAMYVAYNRFYPPDLAHYEARNASPDRSHNETFDALVQTGILGYLAYWIVFYTVIYMALIYLRVIDDRHGRPLYIALLVTGVVALLIIYSDILPIKFSPGPPLLGVVVLALYLVAVGFFMYDWKAKVRSLDWLLIALVSAVVAHFVEIQFGIAIASTRTHFWLFAAMIVVAGRLNQDLEPGTASAAKPEPVQAPAPAQPQRPILAAAAPPAPRQPVATASWKKKSKTVVTGRPRQEMRPAYHPQRPEMRPPSHPPRPARVVETDLMSLITAAVPVALPLAIIGGIILTTMAYNFMLPPNATTTPAKTTPMQFWLYFVTWVSCGLVVAFDSKHDARYDEANQRLSALIVYTAVSLGMWVGYVGMRSVALSLSAQVDPRSLVTVYYATMLMYGLLMAVGLYVHRRPDAATRWGGPVSGMVGAILVVVAVAFIAFTNANVVLADVDYKTGLAYDNAQSWAGSIAAYQSAIRLTPGQDFYYLFLGRSFMELARTFPDRQASPPYDEKTESPLELTRTRLAMLGRNDLIRASLVVLNDARRLNPLNTDHYANLARLYRYWGEATSDSSKFATADKYFQQATSLSPNNAQLWNEWAIVSILRGQLDDGQSKLDRSLELDDRYDLTYYYRGNLYMNRGESSQDDAQRLDYLTKSAEAYSACLKVTPTYWECAKARGYIYGKYMGRSQEAISDFVLVVNSLPRPEDLSKITNASQKQQATQELINVHQNLAITYGQVGLYDLALQNAQVALSLSPQDQALKNLVEQLKAQQKK